MKRKLIERHNVILDTYDSVTVVYANNINCVGLVYGCNDIKIKIKELKIFDNHIQVNEYDYRSACYAITEIKL